MQVKTLHELLVHILSDTSSQFQELGFLTGCNMSTVVGLEQFYNNLITILSYDH